MDRREILKRTLTVNARWNLGSAGCHDIEKVPETTNVAPEPESEHEGYIVSLDLETGKITVNPSDTESI